ncbi:MAG TPA: InlB B-repeat-containing protein [Luteolibacter sp.]|nr:InlB B-repeat-containing protein [Luteolibacter sp.]
MPTPSMLLRVTAASLVAAICAHANPLIDTNTPAGVMPVSGGTAWQLDFSDEFGGTSLDTNRWGIDVSTSSRAARTDRGISDWWWKSQNVSVDGAGNLKLDVVKFDSNTMHCGSVSSDGKYDPTYGYFEARIQIADTTKDTHTAFWLQSPNMTNSAPDDNSAADGAEVDIFESAWFGDYTKAVVHIDGYTAITNANTKQYTTPNLHSGYHVFGLEWTADSMKIYYDGVLKATYTGTWVPLVPEYVWLSVGASFGDIGTFQTEPNGLLTSAYVDYVRVWKALPTYRVTYNGNGSTGGSVPIDGNSYLPAASVTVLGNSGSLVRTGYQFAGWNTAADGSGTSYATGASFTMGAADATLYAMWSAVPTYTVTYNGNGKTSGTVPANQTKTQGVNLTLATNSGNLARTGYAFAGWNTNAAGTGTNYAAGGTYTTDAAITLYAKWNALPVPAAGADRTVYLSAGQSWTPASISTAAWYDAADAASITHSAGEVSQWNDKSGNARHLLQASSTNRPIYGATSWNGTSLPALSFDGTDDYIESASTIVQASTTMIAVYDQAQASSSSRPFGIRNTAGSNKMTFAFGTDNSLRYDGTSTNGTISASLGQHLRVASRTSSAQTDYLDGSPNINATVTLPTHADGYINVGNTNSALVCPFSSKVAEAILIAGTIPQATREQVEGYLAHKWGLTGKLPAGHPYKTSVPSTSSVTITLAGTASDPEGAALTTSWSVVSGPATVTFGNASALNSTASFPVAGTYTLRLTAGDGVGQATDDLVITVNAATPYSTWSEDVFALPFADTDPTHNPDGDSLSNLQEFAFGTDPTDPATGSLSFVEGGALTSPGTPVTVKNGSTRLAVFARRKDHATAGLTYSVQFSADMAAWTTSSDTPTLRTSPTDPADYEAVSVPYPSTNPAPKFFRVGVTSN